MLWDIFCRVIDNLGDIGVCWRLCAQLAQRGHTVRLWVDDGSALDWMAPGALDGRWPGVQVHPWQQAEDGAALAALPRADVWVEAFGCDIPPVFIANYSMPTRLGATFLAKKPVWINLEYLSAEGYVERVHTLPSPVLQGPGAGWTKHFFYPGFTPATGGLLRAPDLLARQSAFERSAWLAAQGIPWAGERIVSLFCYEPLALGAWLAQLAQQPTLLLVCAGRAQAAVRALPRPAALRVVELPLLSQPDFDHLLWASDCNLVRGEDSLVRALWAGKPLLWQLYAQQDGAHGAKLEAFLDLLGADAPLRTLHRQWNGLAALGGDTLAQPQWTTWQKTVQDCRARLGAQDDLLTQLTRFVQGCEAKKS